ncbi:MAG: PQQ-binding-like beta-propeller repeat protein [Gemmataceae bacterium]
MGRIHFLIAALAFSGFLTVASSPLQAEPEGKADKAVWPQWRGPQRDGIVQTTPSWPNTLQNGSFETLWRVDLAEGYPGPIVSEDAIFVAETKNRQDEIVRALDRKTGKQLWEYSWKGSMTVPFFAASNGSWIRSTPAYDGKSLYIAGMRDVLVCLDAKTGKPRWRVDFMERYKTPLPAFGFVCSPLVDGDAVYVQAAASFLKLNKNSGETIWRSLQDNGGMYGSAFSSPTISTIDGKKQILVQTRTTLAGVDMGSGEPLWKQDIPAMRGMNILTPTVYKNGIFISAYGAKTYLFQPEKDSVKTAWTLPFDANMSSPVIIGKYAYLHLKNQRFTCVDLESGKTMWTTSKAFGKYWSMVAQGDKILALDQKGILYLIKANPEKFELIDEKKVSDQETWGHIAIAGDEIFIRELKGLIALRWTQPKTAQAK